MLLKPSIQGENTSSFKILKLKDFKTLKLFLVVEYL